ncbi:MAG: hypothetical protein RR147_01535 [Oscillospiraceae bacterium]
MKNKKIIAILVAVLIMALGIGVGAYAASNFGTQDDPLVAKSYLDQKLTPQLQAQFQSKLDEQVMLMEKEIASAASASGANFTAVSLAKGQTLKSGVGCEIVLRSGTAACIGTGMSDTTSGSAVSSGAALEVNHLYLSSADGDGLTASSAVTLLIRGTYKVV